MNKLELISALKTESDISKAEAAKIVQIFFDNMADAMANTIAVTRRIRTSPTERLDRFADVAFTLELP